MAKYWSLLSLILVSWTWQVSCPNERVMMFCPAVQEGKTATLHCSASWPAEHGRFLAWNKRAKAISICDKSRACENFAGWANASTKNIGNVYVSSIEIHKTTLAHRHDIFKCLIYDYPKFKDIDLKQGKCRLQIYSIPDKPTCDIKVVDAWGASEIVQRVNVRCGPWKVYPRMICRLKQEWAYAGEKVIEERAEQFEYKPQPVINSDSEYEQECSVSFHLSVPGTYRYSIQIRPDLEEKLLLNNEFPMTPFSNSPVINISTVETAVKIIEKKSPNDMACPERNQLTYVCYSIGFKSNPSFEWLRNGYVIQGTSEKTSCTEKLCQSELSVVNSQDSALITCIAKTDKERANQTINSPFSRSLYPSPEVEINNGEGKYLALKEGVYTKLVCKGQNPDSIVTSLHVLCKRGQSEVLSVKEELKYFAAAHEASLDFYLSGSANLNQSTVCTCWAQFRELCYPQMAQVFVEFYSASKESLRFVGAEMDNKSQVTLVFIFSGVVILLIGIVIVLIFSRMRKRPALQQDNIHNDEILLHARDHYDPPEDHEAIVGDRQEVDSQDDEQHSEQDVEQDGERIDEPDGGQGDEQDNEEDSEETVLLRSEVNGPNEMRSPPNTHHNSSRSISSSQLEEAERRHNQHLSLQSDWSVHRNSSLCNDWMRQTHVKTSSSVHIPMRSAAENLVPVLVPQVLLQDSRSSEETQLKRLHPSTNHVSSITSAENHVRKSVQTLNKAPDQASYVPTALVPGGAAVYIPNGSAAENQLVPVFVPRAFVTLQNPRHSDETELDSLYPSTNPVLSITSMENSVRERQNIEDEENNLRNSDGREQEIQGREREGRETEGREREGREIEGREREGRETEGRERERREIEGRKRERREIEGRKREGREIEGREREGRETEGRERKGRETEGRETAKLGTQRREEEVRVEVAQENEEREREVRSEEEEGNRQKEKEGQRSERRERLGRELEGQAREDLNKDGGEQESTNDAEGDSNAETADVGSRRRRPASMTFETTVVNIEIE